jgi:metallo-beta-lactamase class B
MSMQNKLLLLLPLMACAARAQYQPANAEWNRPVEPFKIVGNVYYVGAASVSSFLITTPQGHILLDAGYRETAPLVEAGIRKLGVRVEDIKLLLASHAHTDHAGGLAAIKARTKARFVANPRDAEQFARGGKGDFKYGDQLAFPPVKPDGVFRDGEQIRLGDVTLTAHFTPGHTKGCTTYSAKIPEGARVYDVVFPCSLTAPEYQLVGNTKYPEIVRDYESSFAKLAALPCDVFTGGHSWDFGMDDKRKALQTGAANPFVDPQGYRAWEKKSEDAFHKQLADEKSRKR